MSIFLKAPLLSFLTATVFSLPLVSTASESAEKPLSILVGFPPGGAADIISRLLAEELRISLDRPVLVVNRPGAGGIIATRQLLSAPADGSAVMLTIDHTHVITPLTHKNAGFDPEKDFTSLAGVSSYYNVMAVNGSIGADTLNDLKKWLKDHPNSQSYGVPAAGSVPQFAGLLVGQTLGIPLVPVPYNGGAPLVSDLLGGHVPIGFLSLFETIDHHKTGKLRVLAISGTERAESAPDIPTFEEAGVQGIDMNPWLGFIGPKGLPLEFINSFTRAVEAALEKPEIANRLNQMGNVVTYAPPKELDTWISKATSHWGEIIANSGFEKQ